MADKEDKNNPNLDPELLSLVRDKRRDGWNDSKIKEWLTEERSLYSAAQVNRVFEVLNEAEEPMKRKAAKTKARRERSYGVEKAVFLSLITAGAVFFIAISPLPKVVAAHLFGQYPGSCAYLDGRYCGKGAIIKEADGNNYLAFNLPSGSLVFAPFTGVFDYNVPDYAASGIYTVGNVAIVYNNATTTFQFYSYFQPMVFKGIVTKGEPIAIIKGPAVDEASNANFLIKE